MINLKKIDKLVQRVLSGRPWIGFEFQIKYANDIAGSYDGTLDSSELTEGYNIKFEFYRKKQLTDPNTGDSYWIRDRSAPYESKMIYLDSIYTSNLVSEQHISDSISHALSGMIQALLQEEDYLLAEDVYSLDRDVDFCSYADLDSVSNDNDLGNVLKQSGKYTELIVPGSEEGNPVWLEEKLKIRCSN